MQSGVRKSQAGALNEAVWETALKEGKVNTEKVRAFYSTPAYYDYNWTINGNVDELFGPGTKSRYHAPTV